MVQQRQLPSFLPPQVPGTGLLIAAAVVQPIPGDLPQVPPPETHALPETKAVKRRKQGLSKLDTLGTTALNPCHSVKVGKRMACSEAQRRSSDALFFRVQQGDAVHSSGKLGQA